MFTCGGSTVELLDRLVKRLDEVKTAISSGQEDIEKTFEEITENMLKLKKQLCQVNRKDEIVLRNFQDVAKNIDEILTSARRQKEEKVSFSQAELIELEKKLDTIKSKISEANVLTKEDLPEQEPKAEEEAFEEKEEDVEYSLEKKIQESSAWSHLKLVVDSFETQLKRCLFCLTVFPPDAVIKKRLLFHWWMGEGIIKDTTQGKKCFDKLVSKGFIIPIAERHCPKPHYCKIQTWIRRLLIAVAKSNAFLEYDPTSFPSVDYSRSGRACLRLRLPLQGVEDDSANRRLKTIYNVSKSYIEFADEWLINKEKLATMQLGRWREQEAEVMKHHIEVKSDTFLNKLGNCQDLKYVSLRGVSRIEKLPDQFDKLSKLVVLDLRACHNLEMLPKTVGSAKTLEYLDISECYLLDRIPKTLSNLSKLQVFKGFIVGDYANKELLQVADLTKLTNLRKLNISTGRDFRDEELERLYELKNLTCLTIIWAVIQKEQQPEPSPDKETAKQPINDANKEHPTDADPIQEEPTTAEEKKPSTSRVSPTMDADEKKSDQASSLKAATPSEPIRGEKKKVQLPVHETADKAVKKSSTTTGQDALRLRPKLATAMTRPKTPVDPPSDVIPPGVEKLDLQCYNKKEFPIWIAPKKLEKLKKLYIRGGKLESLGDGKGWKVEVLRLRYLDYLDGDWEKLGSSFPELQCVELFKCKKLEESKWPCHKPDDEDNPDDERSYWFKDSRAESRGH